MNRAAMLLLVGLQLQLCAGCTTNEVRQGFYEGFRVRSDLRSSPSERIGKPVSMDYQEYERLRKEH